MKLELKHLAPYLPYGLNILYWNGLAKEYIEILQVLHYENRHVLGSEKHKPILRPLSDLSKEIACNGKTFIPLIELFKLARGCYEMYIKHYSIMSSEWIKIEMLGYRDYHLRLISIEGDIRIDKGYSFEMFSTDLRADHKKIELVQNHNLLFKKLFEWHFDVYGLIEQGLAIDINTLND